MQQRRDAPVDNRDDADDHDGDDGAAGAAAGVPADIPAGAHSAQEQQQADQFRGGRERRPHNRHHSRRADSDSPHHPDYPQVQEPAGDELQGGRDEDVLPRPERGPAGRRGLRPALQRRPEERRQRQQDQQEARTDRH